LGFSTQVLSKWEMRPICDRDWGDAQLTNAIVRDVLSNRIVGYAPSDRLTAGLPVSALPSAGDTAATECFYALLQNHDRLNGLTGSGSRAGALVDEDLECIVVRRVAEDLVCLEHLVE
jgi:hypothetical protein